MMRLVVLVILILAPAAHAQDLGRLFFTPQQRSDLDARRKARVPDKPAAAAVVSPVTRVDGYVRRSAGPSTVWINGESVTDTPPEGGKVSVPVGEGASRARLKPGESLDRGNGAVRDVIGDGEIRIERRE